jgi:hypothetical protein
MLNFRSDVTIGLMLTVLVMVGVIAAAGWVYRDARAHEKRGIPIVHSTGNLHIRTPAAWFVACVLLFELFIPTYLDSRHPA